MKPAKYQLHNPTATQEPPLRGVHVYTETGTWRAEIFPGIWITTDRPYGWKRFWMFVLFGIRFRRLG